jgi:hypothetical protein
LRRLCLLARSSAYSALHFMRRRHSLPILKIIRKKPLINVTFPYNHLHQSSPGN